MGGSGWIFDGTLAYYDGWRGLTHIGTPIPQMLMKVKNALYQGTTIKIFTARVSLGEQAVDAIRTWLRQAGLPALEITNKKDMSCVEIWDDRARRVIANTGRFA